MRQLGIRRRFRQAPVLPEILQVEEVQQAVFQAHAAYESEESQVDTKCSSTAATGSKWKRIKRVALEALVESGQRKRAVRRFDRLSEFDLQGLVFSQDATGPYLR